MFALVSHLNIFFCLLRVCVCARTLIFITGKLSCRHDTSSHILHYCCGCCCCKSFLFLSISLYIFLFVSLKLYRWMPLKCRKYWNERNQHSKQKHWPAGKICVRHWCFKTVAQIHWFTSYIHLYTYIYLRKIGRKSLAWYNMLKLFLILCVKLCTHCLHFSHSIVLVLFYVLQFLFVHSLISVLCVVCPYCMLSIGQFSAWFIMIVVIFSLEPNKKGA